MMIQKGLFRTSVFTPLSGFSFSCDWPTSW